MRTIALTKIWNRNNVYYGRYSVVSIEKWISIRQLVPVLFGVLRSPGCFEMPTKMAASWGGRGREIQNN